MYVLQCDNSLDHYCVGFFLMQFMYWSEVGGISSKSRCWTFTKQWLTLPILCLFLPWCTIWLAELKAALHLLAENRALYMQISHSSQQVFCHFGLRHTDCSSNSHACYNGTLSIARICTCCTFHKQVNWAVSPGQPPGIEPFCPLSFFRKVMTAMSVLVYPSWKFCSV